VQKFQSLRTEFKAQLADAGNVATGMVQAGHESNFYGVGTGLENNWYLRRRRLGGKRSGRTTRHNNYRNFAANQIGG